MPDSEPAVSGPEASVPQAVPAMLPETGAFAPPVEHLPDPLPVEHLPDANHVPAPGPVAPAVP